MTLKARAWAGVGAHESKALDLGAAMADVGKRYTVRFTHGTGAGQADLAWSKTGTLAASASVDLNLAGGLTDAFGNALTFANVKVLLVAARAGNTHNLIVGGAPTPFAAIFGGSTHTIVVRPGEVFSIFAGSGDATAYPVVAGSSDLLRLTNAGSTASVSYDVVIVGSSGTVTGSYQSVYTATY